MKELKEFLEKEIKDAEYTLKILSTSNKYLTKQVGHLKV